MGTLNISLHPMSSMAVVYEQSTGAWRLLKHASAPSNNAAKTEQLLYVDSPLDNVDITVGELAKMLLGIADAVVLLTSSAYSDCEETKHQYGITDTSNIIAACPSGQVRYFSSPRTVVPSYDMNQLFPIGIRYNGSLEAVYCKDSNGYHWCSRRVDTSYQTVGVSGKIEMLTGNPEEAIQMSSDELIGVVVSWLDTFGDINTQAQRFFYTTAMLYT